MFARTWPAAAGRGTISAILGLALAGAGLASTPARGAADCGDTYHVVGTVVDAVGAPVANARVRLLLDKVSKRAYARHGIRAVPATTDGRGEFRRTVVCSKGDVGPCARNPRHVTVLVADGFDRTKLHVFRLRDLEPAPAPSGCRVMIPAIELSGGFR